MSSSIAAPVTRSPVRDAYSDRARRAPPHRPPRFLLRMLAVAAVLASAGAATAGAQFVSCPSFVRIAPVASPRYHDTVTVTVTWGEDTEWVDPGTQSTCVAQELPPSDASTFSFKRNGTTVSLTTGTGTATGLVTGLLDRSTNVLVATVAGWDETGSPRTDVDTLEIYVDTWPRPIVSLEPYPADMQSYALCALSCFAVRQSYSSVPYFSLDQPRSVTLSYNSDRVALRPFVATDVTVPTGASVPQKYWLRAQVQWSGTTWSDVRFLNGDTTLRFTAASGLQRLTGQFDATQYGGLATGVYPMRFIVTADYGGTKTQPDTQTTRLLVVDDRTSPYGRGWRLANVQRLYVQGDGSVLIVEGDGSALHFTWGCTPSCGFISPRGEFSKLTDSGVGHGRIFWRSYPDSSRATFAFNGLLTSLETRFGETTSFTYGSGGEVTRISDPFRKFQGGASYYLELGYSSGRLAWIREPGQSSESDTARITRVRIATDGTQRLTAIVDPDGDSTRYAYDDSLRLSTVTNRRGGVTRYFSSARSATLDSVQLPQIALDAGGGAEDTTAAPLTMRYRPWQTVGVPTTTTAVTPGASVRGDSVTARMTDAIGRHTSFTVDRWGQAAATTGPDGRTTTVYRTSGIKLLPDSVRDADGQMTRYTWTSNGRLSSQLAPGEPLVIYTYASNGAVNKVSRAGQLDYNLAIGSRGQVLSTQWGTLTNTISSFTYDTAAFFRVRSVTDPEGHVARYRYHATFGNLDSTSVPGGRYTIRRFDRFGRDSALIKPNQPVRRTLYDVLNRTTTVYNGVDSLPVRYGYDALFLTRVEDPKQQVFRFQRNALGWPTREFDPADTLNRFITVRYDRSGRVTSTTNRRNQRVDVTHDSLGRTVARRSGGALIDSTVFSADELTLTTLNNHARETVHRRTNGWVDSVVTRVAGKRLRTRYIPDSLFRLDSVVVTDSVGAVTFAGRRFRYHPSFGSLDTVRVAGKTVAVHRDDDFRVDTVSWNAEARRVQQLNDIHRLAGYSLTKSGTTLAQVNFAYDSLGRLAESWNASGGTRYGYDGLGRLGSLSSYTGASCPPPSSHAYFDCLGPSWTLHHVVGYDAAGNRDLGTGTLYATGNRLVRTQTDSLQYDADGNLTWRRTTSSGRTVTYSWSPTGLLDSVHVGSVGIRYLYDANGRLLARRRNGVAERYFLWNGAQLLAELNGTLTQKVAEYVYLPGELDAPLAVVDDSGGVPRARYVSQDASGNVREVVNATTGVVEQASGYDEWGAPAITGQSVNRLHWKALLWEADSVRLYYMRNRWYDPSVGRFISEDPIGLAGGLNRYTFASNDPINRADPLGLSDTLRGRTTTGNDGMRCEYRDRSGRTVFTTEGACQGGEGLNGVELIVCSGAEAESCMQGDGFGVWVGAMRIRLGFVETPFFHTAIGLASPRNVFVAELEGSWPVEQISLHFAAAPRYGGFSSYSWVRVAEGNMIPSVLQAMKSVEWYFITANYWFTSNNYSRTVLEHTPITLHSGHIGFLGGCWATPGIC